MKVAAAIALAVTALSFVAQQVRAWPSVQHVETQTYDLAGDGVVAVDDVSGDVSVIGWNSDKVEVTTTKTSWSDDDLHRLGTQIDAHPDRISLAATYPSNCLNCDVSFQIRVPTGAHVTIATSSGDISVKSLSGPARADSASGEIKFENVGGQVHVHSSSGDLTLDRIGSAIDAYASSGDIEARHLATDANLVSSSGSVTAEFAHFDAVHVVRMESSSGDISLTVPRGVGFKIEASTGSGSIDSNLQLPIHERDSGADVIAQVGQGKASVELRATSGDIGITMR